MASLAVASTHVASTHVASTETITLVSKEGDTFVVPKNIGCLSLLVNSMVDDDRIEDEPSEKHSFSEAKLGKKSKDFLPNDPIPLPNVSSSALRLIIEFLHKYNEEPVSVIEKPLKTNKIADLVQPWYAKFVNIDSDTLFELIQAANYMDIKPLLDLTCAKIACIMKGQTPDEIRTLFKIDSTDAAH